MKRVKPTRKVKEEITRHFVDGGTVLNLPRHLNGTPMSIIMACLQFAETKKKRRA